MQHRFRRLMSYLLLAALIGSSGCSANCLTAPSPNDNNQDDPPLQPLVYTESAEASPRAVAIREQRLLRQLRAGAEQSGSWGGLQETDRDLPVLDTPEALGEVIGRSLLNRDETLWSHAFVPANAYGKLVNLEKTPARRFVDRQQADSEDVWSAFHVDNRSKLPAGGLSGVFSVGSLTLGAPRTLDGDRAKKNERPIQYWNNYLTLKTENSQKAFQIAIPKIIRIPPALSTDGRPRFGLAGNLSLGEKLDVFLSAGLHFDVDVLSGADYPFPLNVGNFWKYRRTIQGPGRTDSQTSPEQLTVLVEVMEVDRFQSWRIVHLRSVNLNRRGGRHDIRWLLTPRRIYVCDSVCRRHAGELDRLLTYIERHPPLFVFPVELSETWGDGRQQIETAKRFETIESDAGQFSGSISMRGTAAGGAWTIDATPSRATRWFAPRTGVVKREFELSGDGKDAGKIVRDTLTEYRLMEQ